MNKSFRKFSNSILWGALICIAGLAFASCKNFMNAADVKREIEEAIEIANSNPVTIYVDAEEGSGTVTPTQLRLKKKEAFEVMYKPSSMWRFVRWEVLDRNTLKPVEGAILFDDETALVTKARFLQPQENLMIYARAVIIPNIVKVSPLSGSTNNAYVPINITFNIPMEDPETTTEKSLFNYNNISITHEGNSISKYFENPIFNNDKTVLTIMPKARDLYGYMLSNKIQLLDVNISFNDRIGAIQNGIQVSLPKDENSSFSVYYKPVIENSVPSASEFIISGKSITPENVNTLTKDDCYNTKKYDTTWSSDDNWSNEDILHNRASDIIYIYGKILDEDSSIKSVTISEERIKSNTKGYANNAIIKPVTYSMENATFIQKGEVTEFFIRHEIKSKGGLVKFIAKISDVCDNILYKEFYLFRVSEESFVNFYPHNFDCFGSETGTFNETTFNNNLKTIVIPVSLNNNCYSQDARHALLEEVVYMDSTDRPICPDRKKFKITCSYSNGQGDFIYNNNDTPNDINDDFWSYTLNVSSVEGVNLAITITDDIGVSMTKNYTIPRKQSVTVKNNQATFYSSGYSNSTLIYNSATNAYCFNEINETFDVENGSTYKYVPVNEYPYHESWDGIIYSFCGPISSTSFNSGDSASLGYLVEVTNVTNLSYYSEIESWCSEITFAGDIWSKFDSIYYSDPISNSLNQPGENFIPYGSKSFTYIYPGNNFYLGYITGNTYEVEIYGIKDNKKSASNPINIPVNQQAFAEIDNSVPDPTFNRVDLYNYTVKIRDDKNKYISILKKNGEEEIIAQNVPKGTVITIPVVSLETEANDFGVWTLIVKNKNGKTKEEIGKKTEIKGDYFLYRILPVTINQNTYWIFDKATADHFYWSELNTSTKTWSSPVELEKKVYTNNYGGTFYGTYEFPANTVIRISSLQKYGASNSYSSGYNYFYTNNSTGEGSGFLQKLSDSQFYVTADAPTFVHTIKTDKPFSVCSQWSVREWEAFNESIGDNVYNFNSDSVSPKKYDVPVAQIDRGNCYVVIAYFAQSYYEGTNVGEMEPFMSEVMIKQ